LAIYATLLLRFEGAIPYQYQDAFIHLSPLFTGVTLIFLFALKLYSRIWEYASIGEMLAILRATTCSVALSVIAIYMLNLPHFPRSVYIGSYLMINAVIGASRISWRLLRDYGLNHQTATCRKVLIVGAGDAGAILAREIHQNPNLNLKAVGFIDDDRKKQHMILGGIPVLGNRRLIPDLVKELEINEIIIAMPSVDGQCLREIVDIACQSNARVRILPGIYDSAQTGLISRVRGVQMEDLLRRKPVRTNIEEIAGYIQGKSVLITGAGGSIGSELCRQALAMKPSRLIMVDNCENNLFDIDMELRNKNSGVEIHPELIDVKNRDRLETAFRKYCPQVVFHAAAYKHVPMMELHPEEAFTNNVIGTRNMAELADRYKTRVFIMVSTDKAVNPTSVMGASKRLSELVVKDFNRISKTKYAAVRFGNVLGSRGSVIPTFLKQIEAGGPVTVTHPEMRRYFMTIPEAVALILQAGALAEGGEIFVLDMGQMVKIDDLARDLITLTGRKPDIDIPIVYTGIRPGEKLYEELFSDRENMAATKHERIFISKKEMDEAYIDVNKTILAFARSGLHNPTDVLDLITNLLPEYQPGGERQIIKTSAG
jgi:FlaA1/EpsC-like NDP-sugar epimerase